MALADDFKSFCGELLLDNLEEMQKTAGEITKKLNSKYYNFSDEKSEHLYIVGSVGRETAVKNNSDLDIIFDLPNSVYQKYNAYASNGQSALLQEVKEALLERYPKTTMKGDGQVVVIEFTRYTVELVPAFKQSDGRFKYPDTHNGGSWKYTDPLSEQNECTNCNTASNGIYYDFCHLIRSWKNHIGFDFGGLLIDTLVYNHFSSNSNYSVSGHKDYIDILQSTFEYLKGLNKDQSYWFAVGSNQQVSNSDNGTFVDKADAAYSSLKSTIDNGDDVNSTLQTLFGKAFPASQSSIIKEVAAASIRSYRNTEQFIEDIFPVDIRYSLHLDCKVSQDGWRDFSLIDFLRGHGILRHNKKLDFFIARTNAPKPYSIYWKVRNVGKVAESKNCIRGQIKQTDSDHQKESTDFYGSHFVECYLVKENVCVARGRIDVPIGTA